jgi:integrase
MKNNRKRQIPVTIHAGITIREVRPSYYMVDHMVDGHRERKCFNDLEKAKGYCSRQALRIKREGSSVFELTAKEREEAKRALDLLSGKATLIDAARLWIRHNASEDGLKVRELGDRWLANLRRQGCRETTLSAREYQVGRWVKDMGDRSVISLTRKDVADWLDSTETKGSTWDTYRRVVRAMLQYATDESIIELNPAAGIKAMRLDEKLPKPFSADDAAAILHTAESYAPLIVPTLVAQFFAGIRPGEALGLDWSSVDFGQKLLRVKPETSKVRRTRLIEMNSTLVAWLQPYRKKTGPLGITTKSQFSYYMDRKRIGPEFQQLGVPLAERKDARPKGLCSAAKVEWIQDGPRKTFATMHFATYQDAGKLAAILGHTSGSSVLYRHYRGLATKAEARKYWKIRPRMIS